MLVAHDRKQPGLEIGPGLEALDVVEGTHQSFLHEIVGSHAVSGE